MLNHIVASPVRFQMMCETSNWCTLSWQRPPIYYRGHGSISNYFVNCSTEHTDDRRDDQTLDVTYSSTYATLRLQPYRFYNCCVAAVNEAGRGDSTCQTIITHEAGKLYTLYTILSYIKFMFNNKAPTATPTELEAYQLNSTSVFLSWKPPLIEYQNGIIRGYYVELNSTDNAESPYTLSTQDQHLLLDSLQPDTVYICRVAAYTVGRGPFSEPLTIVLDSESGMSKGYANTLLQLQAL